MSQAKLTDFYNTRKINTNLHPSKRRKVETSSLEENEVVSAPVQSGRTKKGRAKKGVVSNLNAQTSLPAPASPPAKDSGETEKAQIYAEPSSSCDDHNGSPTVSPSKRQQKTEATSNPKRARSAKGARKDLLKDMEKPSTSESEKSYDFAPFPKDVEKLELKKWCDQLLKPAGAEKKETTKRKTKRSTKKRTVEDPKPVEVKEEDPKPVATKAEDPKPVASKAEDPKPVDTKAEDPKPVASKATDPKPVASKAADPKPVAPKAADKKAVKQKSEDPKADELTAKAKTATKVPLHKKYEHLAKKTQEEEKLEKLSTLTKKTERTSAVPSTSTSSTSSTPKKLPAYQRFAHLAEKTVPGTLQLPRSYSLLEEMFRSADTVVSMLYKRSETCTFSKLKAAVQKMICKNFEEVHLGQVKTVMPMSYSLRQDKGLPKHGYRHLKASEYQLTIEPILDTEGGKFDKDGRPMFTAEQMTQRKNFFHRALISLVKKFHKEFLAALDRPLAIDDDKLTNWHPSFKLDKVPEIKPAELPKPPNVKKLTTAREVLEEAKGTLNPRIQRALELISGPEPSTSKKSGGPSDKNQSKTPEKKETSGALKGVSSSLLERIRAKESRQQEAALMRTPAQQKRQDQIQRLPDLCRILLNLFVTARKPALPWEQAVSKMAESYRTPLSLHESETHLELMVELVPEWIQLLKIARGNFVKVDKNKDINAIIKKLEGMKEK